MNIYAYCAQCGFGIELNISRGGVCRAEYYFEKDGNRWCYYCYESKKPRTTAQLKSIEADSAVLLASAKRVSDTEAVAFYSNQLERARAALGAPALETEAQGDLFNGN